MTGQTEIGDYVQPVEPSLGKIVVYRDHQNRDLAAIVTCTQDSWNGGPQPCPPSRLHVHLTVFSQGGQNTTGQYDVPHSYGGEADTWRWPTGS